MNNIIIIFLKIALIFTYPGHFQTLKPSPQKDRIIQAKAVVSDYHSDAPKVNNNVKLVYFYGNDSELQSNLDGRLTRILDDVSDFYSEEFLRHRIDLKGVPFEKVNGKYIFHFVKGDSSSKSYNIKSGPVIINEIRRKTAGSIDLSKDYILVINSLWYKRNDGTYVFHSPYFGMGSSINGICMVADCELLDPLLLKNKTQKMKFSEMTVALKECPVSEFNSWYIGGIAHEMAHIFGLPHDFGNKLELESSTISLMGQYGSRHFRDYLWDGEKTAVFSSASIIQLISHPIFTQSNKNKTLRPRFTVLDVAFSLTDSEFILNGKIKSDLVPYAVVALIRPLFLNEYFNQSSSELITTNDSFSIKLGQLLPGDYNLLLVFVFPNGMTTRVNKKISIDQEHLIKVIS